MFDPSILIGLDIADAEVIANTNGFTLRVMCEDGQHLFGTCDYDESRINISTQDNIVLPGFNFG